ncbi:hypothetical protein KI387_028431, partial [Taxus chinensis]
MVIYYCSRREKQKEIKGQIDVFESFPVEKSEDVGIPVPNNQTAELIFYDETAAQRFQDVQSLIESATWIKLGRGTAGPLFKWVLKEGGGAIVAARKLENITASREELANRLIMLKNIAHRNLLPLRCGFYCGEIPYLVYDYLCLGSVEDLLMHEGDARFTPLNWAIRACVSLGTARGIAAIHRSSEELVCGVIKSSNVLLKSDMRACLCGYELPYLAHSATIVGRNPGAVAPELLHTNAPVFSHKSDVYSFGVFLLELVTGRRPRTCAPGGRVMMDLRDFVRLSAGTEIFDPAVDRDGSIEEEMKRMVAIAEECLCDIPEERPTMKQVVGKIKLLRGDGLLRRNSTPEFEQVEDAFHKDLVWPDNKDLASDNIEL